MPPDPIQFQVMLGSLLGDGRLVGVMRQRRLRVAHSAARGEYVRWKYDRLSSFAESPPHTYRGISAFETITHPIFDDLAGLLADSHSRHDTISRLLQPLGLAVWLADMGRLELRPRTFLPAQRGLALAS